MLACMHYWGRKASFQETGKMNDFEREIPGATIWCDRAWFVEKSKFGSNTRAKNFCHNENSPFFQSCCIKIVEELINSFPWPPHEWWNHSQQCRPKKLRALFALRVFSSSASIWSSYKHLDWDWKHFEMLELSGLRDVRVIWYQSHCQVPKLQVFESVSSMHAWRCFMLLRVLDPNIWSVCANYVAPQVAKQQIPLHPYVVYSISQ